MAKKDKGDTAPRKAKGKAPSDNRKEKKDRPDFAAYYNETMDTIAKRQGFEASGLDVAPPISTSLLAIDMILGGGLRACMLTAAGDEQCAKTTIALACMAAMVKEDVPIIGFVDYEGSTKNSKPYVGQVLRTQGVKMTVDQVFGKLNAEGNGWTVPPRVRYRAETILENFYKFMSEVLRELPDKKYVENKWWLVYDDKNKRHKAKMSEFADDRMTKKYGNGLWVEAPDDKMQAIIFLDSYTAMNPEAKDEEEISNQLSVKASAFSKQLERIKGRMATKMVMVYGLNHLRDNPMAMFGPKQSEKGGKALQQFSDVRLRQTSRSLSAAPFSPKANKKFNEVEASVEFPGTEDEYRYVHIKAIKNKLWTPQRETMVRIWVEDGDGKARGICPVFDTIQYLRDTGQLIGTRKAFKIKLNKLGLAKTSLTWGDIKLWILGDKEAMTKLSKKCGFKPMSLRSFCFKQVKSGVAEDLYVKFRNAKAAVKKEKAAKDGDDDGDDE